MEEAGGSRKRGPLAASYRRSDAEHQASSFTNRGRDLETAPARYFICKKKHKIMNVICRLRGSPSLKIAPCRYAPLGKICGGNYREERHHNKINTDTTSNKCDGFTFHFTTRSTPKLGRRFPKPSRSIVQTQARTTPPPPPRRWRGADQCVYRTKKQCALQLIPLLFHVCHPASRPKDKLLATR